MPPRSRAVSPVPPAGGASIESIPYAMTPLIGREAQVAEIVQRLTLPSVRLLTLTGPGGIGKTRLALEAAHRLRGRSGADVQLLRLASVTDPALLPAILARALDIRGPAGQHESWVAARERRGLLIIDNVEQLVAAAPAIVDVLTHCPHITALVTSRVPLNVSGEHQLRVPQLATPPEDAGDDPAVLRRFDAVRLYVDRASTVRPDFRLSRDNAWSVAEIARRLDGLPLAIELAAARARHLTPDAILDRLMSATDVLRDGPVDRPPHQRAVRETIAWSYDLLDADEQRLFRGLSIFAGGFLVDAATHVCEPGETLPPIQLPGESPSVHAAILDRLFALADTTLIFTAEDVRGEPRFAMLRTIRGFGHAELRARGEWDTIRIRHAAWYLALAEAAAGAIRGPAQTAWIDWLETEHANLRAALETLRDARDGEAFAAMTAALSTFWLVRGYFGEGLRWLRMAVEPEMAPASASLRADLLCSAGWLALRQGLPDEGRALVHQSLAFARGADDPLRTAAALRLLGDIEDRTTNYEAAHELLREALGAYRDAGEQTGIADTLTGLAGIAMDNGDYDEAERVFHEAVAAAKSTGDAIILARAIDSLSVAIYAKGEAARALAHAERALELYRTHGNVRGIAVAMDHVGKCSRSLGDLDRAWACHRESLPWRRKVGDPRGMAVWLEAMAGLLAACAALHAAAQVLGAVDTLRRRGGFPIHNHERTQLQPTVNAITGRLTAEDVARAWARGSRKGLPEIVEFAYAEAARAMSGRSDGARPDGPEARLAAAGLTRREMDVARLLVVRLSDKEIGERLGISPRTVSTHVAVILDKLDVRSRRDVARVVTRPGDASAVPQE